MFFKNYITFCLVSLLSKTVIAGPKYDTNSKSYIEDNNNYNSNNNHQPWTHVTFSNDNNNNNNNKNRTEQYELDNMSTKERLQRLGYTTGYGTLNTYPGGTGVGAYSPIKLDLGGVILGTLVGIGAILIIPKILHVFQGGYMGYGRNLDDNDLSSVTHFVNRIDDILGQNNIDTTSCMQRAICTYVRSTEYNMKTGASDQFDEIIHMLSDNALVDYLLDGTAIKAAIEHGKNMNTLPCVQLYITCPLDAKRITQMIQKLLPKKATIHSVDNQSQQS